MDWLTEIEILVLSCDAVNDSLYVNEVREKYASRWRTLTERVIMEEKCKDYSVCQIALCCMVLYLKYFIDPKLYLYDLMNHFDMFDETLSKCEKKIYQHYWRTIEPFS